MPPQFDTESEQPKWWKKIVGFLSIVMCISLAVGIVFSVSVFNEIDKYHIVITPGNPSSVSVESVFNQTKNNRKIDGGTTINSGIKGVITIGPTCPVEKDSPDPNCADKPYSAVIDIRKEGKIIKTFSSKADGTFMTDISPGTYSLTQSYKATMPTFYPVEVTVAPNKYTQINLQFDSGIR